MKKCPFCGASIEDSARFCLHCMTPLTEKEQILLHKKKKPQWIILILVALVVSFALTLLLLGKQTAPQSKTPSDDAPLNPTSEPGETESSDTPPVTESLHIHSYSLENTDGEYQKEKATCTAPAVYYYSCTCGEKGSETFPYGELAEHTVVTDSGYPAGCAKAGLTDGKHCSVCGTVLLSQTAIPVVNHSFNNDQDESCNACSFVRILNCKHTKTVRLPAVSPTCIAAGLTEGKRCALCEEILKAQTVLSPSGHTQVTDQGIGSTCTTPGKTEGKHCSVCNAVLVAQVTVPAKGHTAVIDRAVAATCSTPGKTEGKHCSVCQVVLTPQQELPLSGHTFDPENSLAPCSVCGAPPPHTHNYSVQNTASKYLKNEATCIASAIYYYSCACGDKGSETFSYGETGSHAVATESGYPAGCDKAGLTDKTYCSVCQTVFAPHIAIAAVGHTYRLGDSSPVCLTCGEKGAVSVQQSQEFPLVLKETYRINHCTYVIRPSFGEQWEITFEVNFTNLSSETTNTCPTGSLFLPSAGYGYGDCTHYPTRVQPNESGFFKLQFCVPNTESSYILTFR